MLVLRACNEVLHSLNSCFERFSIAQRVGRVASDSSISDWSFRHTLMLIGAVFCMFALGECVGPEYEFKRDRFHDTLTLSDGQRVKLDIEVVWRDGYGCEPFQPCGWAPYYSVVEVKGLDGVPLVPTWVSKRGVLPMLVDALPDQAGLILVAAPHDCSNWVEIGRPALPYAAFRVEGGRWVRTPLPATTHGLPANITISKSRRWTFSPERLLLMRSPILKDEVYSLKHIHPSVGIHEGNFNRRVQGRNANCEDLRTTVVQ
jgi:hypothetical protein